MVAAFQMLTEAWCEHERCSKTIMWNWCRFFFFFFCLFKYNPSRQAVTGGTQRVCRFVPRMSRPVINPVTTEQDAVCFEKDLDCSPSKWELFYFWSFAPNRRLIVMETGICIFLLWTCLEVYENNSTRLMSFTLFWSMYYKQLGYLIYGDIYLHIHCIYV